MNRTARWVLLVALTLALAAGLARQWQTSALLRIEVEQLRDESRELAPMRITNERLKRERTPASEIARLRADHEAAMRLRAELEALRAASH